MFISPDEFSVHKTHDIMRSRASGIEFHVADFTQIIYLQLPTGTMGTVSPNGLKKMAVILERNQRS
jgi:hypothetical protein